MFKKPARFLSDSFKIPSRFLLDFYQLAVNFVKAFQWITVIISGWVCGMCGCWCVRWCWWCFKLDVICCYEGSIGHRHQPTEAKDRQLMVNEVVHIEFFLQRFYIVSRNHPCCKA